MNIAELFTEGHRLDQIEPDAYANNTYTTNWLSMRDYQRLAAVLMIGTLGSSATIDAKLRQAKTSGGAGAKDVTGKAITQLTQAGSDSDKMVVIELNAEELDVTGKYDHVQLSVTIGTATSDFAALVIRFVSNYSPVDRTNLDEVVA